MSHTTHMSGEPEIPLNDMNVGSSRDGSSSSDTAPSSNLQQHLSMISSKFNFLDRAFANQGASDGVFSNLTAKPDLNQRDETREDRPPTYDEAAQDEVPSYWEAAGVLAPEGGYYFDDVCVNGLPVGNVVNFAWNLLVSASFQFVGFLLTYILHTSHAAKEGSRCGLGVTFVTYAWTMIPYNVAAKIGQDINDKLEVNNPGEYDGVTSGTPLTGELDTFVSGLAGGSSGGSGESSSTPAVAWVLMVIGVFIIVKSVVDYIRAKRAENGILASRNDPGA